MEQNVKILIADENAEERRSLRENLLRVGYRDVEEADNGEDAISKSAACIRTSSSSTHGFPKLTASASSATALPTILHPERNRRTFWYPWPPTPRC